MSILSPVVGLSTLRDTRAVLNAVNLVRSVIENGRGSHVRVLTSFGHRGAGSTVAIRVAATRNGYRHVLVNLARCTAVAKQKQKCLELINSLEAKHRMDVNTTVSGSVIVCMLARILREAAGCLLADCLAAIRLATEKRREVDTSIIVYDLITPSTVMPSDSTSSTTDEDALLRQTWTWIGRSIEDIKKECGCRGVIIQVENSHEVFLNLNDSRPQHELRLPSHMEFPPNRIGVFMLRALAYSILSCTERDRRLIWAFTGIRKGAEYSFYIPSTSVAEDLSEKLEDFDVENVKEVLCSLNQTLLVRVIDPTIPDLRRYWKRLVGPPVVTGYFLEALESIAKQPQVQEGDPISAGEAHSKEWHNIEGCVISILYEKFRAVNFDAEVAKFCCIASLFSSTGQLTATLDTLHSSIITLGETGLLLLRTESEHLFTDKKVYFAKPYPLLLSLFVEKYGLPRYTLRPLLRFTESVKRDAPIDVHRLAEVAFALDLRQIFEGESGMCLLTCLGLKCFGTMTATSPRVTAPLQLECANSLRDIAFDDNRVYVIPDQSVVDTESPCEFSLILEASDTDCKRVVLFICVSLAEYDDETVMGKLNTMASTAMSHWGDTTVRILCVFADPYESSGNRRAHTLLNSDLIESQCDFCGERPASSGPLRFLGGSLLCQGCGALQDSRRSYHVVR